MAPRLPESLPGDSRLETPHSLPGVVELRKHHADLTVAACSFDFASHERRPIESGTTGNVVFSYAGDTLVQCCRHLVTPVRYCSGTEPRSVISGNPPGQKRGDLVSRHGPAPAEVPVLSGPVKVERAFQPEEGEASPQSAGQWLHASNQCARGAILA